MPLDRSAHPPQAAPGAGLAPGLLLPLRSRKRPVTLPARRRPVGSCLPPRFAQFQAGPSLNRRCRYAFARKLARCRAASRAGLRCGGSSPLAASSHNPSSPVFGDVVLICNGLRSFWAYFRDYIFNYFRLLWQFQPKMSEQLGQFFFRFCDNS